MFFIYSNLHVQTLADKTPHFNTHNDQGKTPLHIAVERNRKEITLELLQHSNKLDINTQDKQGRTALHIASLKGESTIVQKLIDLGANVHLKDNRYWTPLNYAASYQQDQVVIILLDNKADPNAANLQGWSSVHSCALQDHGHILKLLIQRYGAEVNRPSYNGYTPLHLAVINENIDAITILVENEADPYQLDHKKLSPFRYTTEKNIRSIFKTQKTNLKSEPQSCKLVTPVPGNLEMNREVHIYLQTYDTFNRRRRRGGDKVIASITHGENKETLSFLDTKTGLYTLNWTPQVPGECSIQISVNDIEIQGSPLFTFVENIEKESNDPVTPSDSESETSQVN